MTLTKRTILGLAFALVLGAVFVLPHVSFAQVQAGLDTAAASSGLGNEDLTTVIGNIIKIVLSVIGVIALLIVLYGGFVWMTAAGNPDQVDRAKRILLNGLIGLILILASYGITSFVVGALSSATGTGGGGGGGGGGSGGTLGGGSVAVLSVSGFSPVGAVSIRNVKPQITFTRPIDAATVDGNVVVADVSGAAVSGTLETSGSRVSFTPSAACPSPNETRFCFAENTAYTVTVSTKITSTSGSALQCSATNCTSTFTTGSAIDTENPVATMTYPDNGSNIAADSSVPVQVHATDDSAVATSDFAVGGVAIDSVSASGEDLSDVEIASIWDTTGLVDGDYYKVTATVTDIAGNTDDSSTTVRARPATCFNGVLDSDLGETGVDCGGDVASATYCGACDGSACTDSAECSSGSCVAGSCASLPSIASVSPADGAVGTYVTVSGTGFGSAAGTISFTGASGALIAASIPSCAAAWSSTQVTVAVPAGAVDGSLTLTTSSGAVDTTNNDQGPTIADFDVNDTKRPGLCSIVPSSGAPNDAVSLAGANFGSSRGSSKVSFGTHEAGSYTSWADGAVGVTAPSTTSGVYAVSVTVDGIASNTLSYTLSRVSTTAPAIVSISPSSGGIGEYVTLTGTDFGAQVGEVVFENTTTGDTALASTDFPSECASDVWNNNEILFIVPSTTSSGAALATGAYTVHVVTQAGATSSSVAFTVTGDAPAPGICSLTPSSGAAGDSVTLYGSHFGTTQGSTTFYSSTLGSVSSWSSTKITTTVPAGATTGPITVSSADGGTSNGVTFTVSGESSGTTTGTTYATAAYAWDFSTGAIPQTPEVVVACSDTQVSGVPNEKFTAEVCVNAVVYAEFTTVMNEATLDDAVTLEKCTAGGNNPCASTSEVTGTVMASSSADASSVTLTPLVDLDVSSTYRVTISTAAKSADDIALAKDVSWEFTTKSTTDACSVEKVVVSPSTQTLNTLDETGEFLALPTSGCVVTDSSSYTWSWALSPESYAAFASSSDGSCDGGSTSCATVKALAQGTTAVSSTETASKVSGDGELVVDFTDPYVVNAWPDCTEACINADIGASFNTPMDSATVASGVTLSLCENELCTSLSTVSDASAACSLDGDGACTGFDMTLGSSLTAGAFYRVVVSSSVTSTSGVGLIRANYGSDYSWTFRVRDDGTLCAVDRIAITPPSVTATSVGEQAAFTSAAYGVADSCSTAGQKLDAHNYSWNWTDPIEDDGPDPSIAVASWGDSGLIDSDPSSIPAGCTTACLAEGSEPHAAICGDGSVGTGEDCDDGNTTSGDLCSSSCLAEGTASPTCGNGTIDIGETCDDKNVISKDGCSSTCRAEGSSSVGATCGNGDIARDATSKAGETCDDGNTTSGDGCSSQCVNEGSATLAAVGSAVCGNGTVTTPYEACDDGNTADGDGCNATCRYEGSSSSYATPSTCGDGSVGTGEECDDGNTANSDGCSSHCLLEGSNTAYAAPSVCGDGSVGTGELAACESGTGADGKADPVQVAHMTDEAVYEVSQDSGVATASIESTEPSSSLSTTASYILSCSATKDSDCTDPETQGVGIGNCCVDRPVVTLSPSGSDVCRNAAITFSSTQNIDVKTLTTTTTSGDTTYRMYAKLDTSATSCPSTHTTLASGPTSILGRIARKVAAFVFGFPVFADTGDCIVPVSSYAEEKQADGTYKVTMTYGAMLEANATYTLVVLGDTDVTDGTADGVLSTLDVGINGTQSQSFTTGSDVCALDAVSVVDTDDSANLFTQTTEAHAFTATALSYKGNTVQEISPVADVYAWEYTAWTSADESIATTAAGSPADTATVTAAGKNGDTTVAATATITADTLDVLSGDTMTGTDDVTALLCENPWPPVASFPWSDDETGLANGLAEEGKGFMHFATSYCRDNGATTTTEDDYADVTVVRPPETTSTNVIKEYLFEVGDGSGDAIGFRVVSNPTFLSPSAWYDAQGFTGSPKATTVDGFSAIADGRTTYVSAPNVLDGTVYSNMYVISYNEGASADTVAIYDQMLAQFSFATNVDDVRMCLSNAGEPVVDSDGNTVACTSDFDCSRADGETCGSDKLRLLRDTRRLTDLTDIQSSVSAYEDENGTVPTLASGTFARSIGSSVWESWTSIFGGALGSTPSSDPLNAYVDCGEAGSPYADFSADNCVNGTNGTYACPEDSFAYHYRAVGSTAYTLTAEMEYTLSPWYSSIDTDGTDSGSLSVGSPEFCDGTTYGSSDLCGDGIVGSAETCELGETGGTSTACDTDGDGTLDGTQSQTCNSTCDGWTTDASATCAASSCGNGVTDSGETCDDGSYNGKYGYCGTDCTYATSFYCGDGSVSGSEACDCGSSSVVSSPTGRPYGGSSISCTSFNGTYDANPSASCAWDCSGAASSCGDGVVDSGEECDGDTDSYAGEICNIYSTAATFGDACTSDSDCVRYSSTTTGALCGDTNNPSYQACPDTTVCLDGDTSLIGTECALDSDCGTGGKCSTQNYQTYRTRTCADDGSSGDSCTWEGSKFGYYGITCKATGTCGDGTVDSGEECDDGNTDSSDSCTSSCTNNVCGDGSVYSGVEQCDEGSANGAGCSSAYGSSCTACSVSCKYESSTGSFCGDSVVNGSEYCDLAAVPLVWTARSETTGFHPESLDTSCTTEGETREVLQIDTSSSTLDSYMQTQTCANAGFCNGNGGATLLGQNGDFCTDDSDCGTGSCAVATCAADCASTCPTSYGLSSVQVKSNQPGAKTSSSVDLYTYDASSTSTLPNAATLTIPACRYATGLTADISFNGVTDPDVYIVLMIDYNKSMGNVLEGTTTRLEAVQTAVKDAVAELFDSLEGRAHIAVAKFASDVYTVGGVSDGVLDEKDFVTEDSESALDTAIDAVVASGPAASVKVGIDGMQKLLDAVTTTANTRGIGVYVTEAAASGTSSTAAIKTFLGEEESGYELYAISIGRIDLNPYSSNTIIDGSGTWVTGDVNANSGIDYSATGATVSEMNDAFGNVATLFGKDSATVTLIGEKDGAVTSTTSTVYDSTSQSITLPDGFACDPDASQSVPVHVLFKGEGQINVSGLTLSSCAP